LDCTIRLWSIKGAFLCLVLLACSCSLALFPRYKSTTNSRFAEPVSWFSADSGHIIFNTSIDVLKNHFSGLLVIKNMGNQAYRVVLITEVGLKVMDMEFQSGQPVKVYYIMDAMNKKALIHTLSNDINLILMNEIHGHSPVLLTTKKTGNTVFRYRIAGGKTYYALCDENPTPCLAKQTGMLTNKVRAEFFGTRDTGIDSIRLSHYNFNLNINLYRITEEASHVTE